MTRARNVDARFRVVDHPDLRVLRLEDETLVFNPVLWHTHLLNPAAALVLDFLEESPATAGEIVRSLAAHGNDATAGGISSEQIEAVLEQLAGLGIAERLGEGHR